MILYIILVISIVALTIFLASLIVRKRHVKYTPPKIEHKPDLNDLDSLIASVKPKKEQTPQQQSSDNQQNQQLESNDQNTQNQDQNSEQNQPPAPKEQEPTTSQQKSQKQNKSSSDQQFNLKQAIKANAIINRKF
jgi:hypothetical protein